MRYDFSKLKHPVTFYEMKTVSENGMPGKPKPFKFYDCFAAIDTVWMRDYQTAVQNNTQHEIKIIIRKYPGIDNKMQLEFNGIMHKISSIMPDYQDSRFMVVMAGAILS